MDTTPHTLEPLNAPERLQLFHVGNEMHDLVGRNIETLAADIASDEDKIALVDEILQALLSKQEEYRERFPNLPWDEQESMRQVLVDQVQELLHEIELRADERLEKQERLAALEKDPEKRSLWEKALGSARKSLKTGWKHKWKIIALTVLIAGGVAGWYFRDQLLALLNGWGLGIGEGAGAAAAGAEGVAAEGAAATVGAEAAEIAALEELAAAASGGAFPSKFHVIVEESGYIFQGMRYPKEQAAELAAKLMQEGLMDDELIKIMRTPDARVLTWDGIYSALEDVGFTADQLYMPKKILK